MVVILIVPIEKPAAEVLRDLDAPEPLRKSRLVFQGFEVAFGKRVVIGRVRPVVRTGDAKIGQQKRGRFGLHWGAAIGVKRELTSRHIVFGDGVLEQRPKQRGAFGIGDAPADHPTAENIQNYVEKEIGPLRRPPSVWLCTTRPRWAFRPAIRVSGRRDDAVADAVRELRHAGPAADTSCGSSNDRRRHPAVWHRFLRVPDPRNAANEAGPTPPVAAHWSAHAPASTVRDRQVVARSIGCAAGARLHAIPQARRRRRWSDREAASVAPRRPSGRAVFGRQRHAQQGCHFFLNVDDRLSAGQTLGEAVVGPLQPSHFDR
jgi:hypothetical protein